LKSRYGPLAVTAIVGFLMVAEWFFDVAFIKNAAAEVKLWAIIIAAFALGLGTVNLVKLHTKAIVRREKGWYGSIFALGSLVLFAVVGIVAGTNSDIFLRMYDVAIGPPGTTMFSILCFSIISAGARCLRIKNVSSTVIIVVILIALLAQTPMGEQYVPGVVPVFNWMMDVINVAGQRGIIIGAALGAFVQALRTLTGLERRIG